MKSLHTLRAITIVALMIPAQQAASALIQGDYLGTYAGNDSEAQLLADLGLVVDELAKVDVPAVSNDGLDIFNLVLNDDDEPIAGDWSYSGPGTVDIIVIKAGDQYAAYRYTDANTGGMLNMGLWDTGDVADKGLSHITAYTVVPVPPAVWLLGSAILGLAFTRRRA